MQWLDSVAGPGYAAAILWTFVALVLLVIILLIIKLVRNLTFGTFVAGGRNRKTRLAVMDATAVDSHRRLVLVRRDDIEHLLLIGGPTDVVVERDIRLSALKPAQSHQSATITPLPAYANAVRHAPAPARQDSPAKQDSIDDTLMRELEVSFDVPQPAPESKPAAKAPSSLDDEMTKLLGELSSQKR
ncbi:MAG: hypothetical protein E5V22_06130 [Mesorhizobium sp.]|nr:MAG: hypothetical protein E5V22_06130 [Mesorhizobium sp.]